MRPFDKVRLGQIGPNTILYLLVHAPSDFSLLQGFSNDLLQLGNALIRIAGFPSKTDEFAASRADVRMFRLHGWASPWAVPIQVEACVALNSIVEQLPTVAFCTDHALEACIQWGSSLQIEPLVVSSSGRSKSIAERELTISRLFDHVLDFQSKSTPTDSALRARPRDWQPTTPLSIHSRSHNITTPSECALEACGFVLALPPKPMNGALGDVVFVHAQAKLARKILSIRKQFHSPFPVTTSLTLQTCSHFIVDLRAAEDAARRDKSDLGKGARFALEVLRKQRGYFQMDSDPKNRSGLALKKGDIQRGFLAIMQGRGLELRFLTGLLSLKAAAEFSSTLRLPPLPDNCRLLGAKVRSAQSAQSRKRGKELPRQYTLWSQALADWIPKEFRMLLRRTGDPIRIVSDHPIEHAAVTGQLPMWLTHDVFRIPETPGNLTSMCILKGPQVQIKQSSLSKILVIQSYDDHDMIARDTSFAIDVFRRALPVSVEVILKSARSASEFVDALNSFDGAILIYDGHSSAQPGRPGVLHLGGERVVPFEMRDALNVPPIVFLASCETEPWADSRASLARTFLLLGARAVIGTAVPVAAGTAASLTARLIYAIHGLSSSVFSIGYTGVRWNTLVSRVIRGQFLTELSIALCTHHQRPPDDALAAIIRSRLLTTSGAPQAVLKSTRLLDEALQLPPGDCLKFALNEFLPSESAFYVQLGCPDSIVVVPDSSSAFQSDRPHTGKSSVAKGGSTR